MDVSQKLDGAELTKLVDWVTGGEYRFGEDISDAEGQPIGSLHPFDAYEEVEEGDWPQSEDPDGIGYLDMVAIQESADKVYEAVEEHGEDVLRVTAEYIASSGLDPIHISDLSAFITLNYKGKYDSPGAFAKWYVRVDGGPAFDERTLEEFNDFIDWESYGTSPNMGDYDLIKPDDQDEDTAGPLYAFDSDAQMPEK
ncbi:hypothetical protein [Streptomyces sp. NPDC017260]|uniref:hypothetical protein n=1 Tax=unclassified Streptomyces TaxID=2593676 RepID=UPI0037A23064